MQISSIEVKAFKSIMDLESFETFDLTFQEDLKNQLAEEKQIEYWDIEGKRSIMRVL